MANAKKKLEDKGLDMIVANDISRADTGFAADTNSVWLLGRDFEVEIGLESKEAIAHKIVDKIVEKLLVRK
jgi:phosphopantothenoylcysteine decarboxylase/phosphopantothenate--cysteine ligase